MSKNRDQSKSTNQSKIQSIKKYQVVPKDEDHGKWYQTVLSVADMIDYSNVSGCYVLKPWACQVWNLIKSELNQRITNYGIEETYFPLFVTESALKKEASHFDDFTPEVAWINTSESHDDKLDSEAKELIEKLRSKGINVNVTPPSVERFAIRPTSETIMYPHFADWIKRNGRYPKINQWANIVRWENKETRPFIRSREFLWQEGHTCHPDRDSAEREMWDMLKMYKTIYEDFLAVPVIEGIKTESETFPGAVTTSTIESFLLDSGRAIQSATSHYLGTKFAQIFNIRDSEGELVHQNSWGFTTRSIGVAVMTHSDNKGLVLPPKIAPVQVILMACGLNSKTTDEMKDNVNLLLDMLCTNLKAFGIRVVFDNDKGESPGMKFNKWETKGVPLRIELGPRDIDNDTIIFVQRYNKEKSKHVLSDVLNNPEYVQKILDDIQKDMLESVRDKVYNSVELMNSNSYTDNDQLISCIQNKRLALIEWSNEKDFEEKLKLYCKSRGINSTKTLCFPQEQFVKRYIDSSVDNNVDNNKKYVLFGRSY